MEAFERLKGSADIVLKSADGLEELYDLKQELTSGAQAGFVIAIDKKTGVSYALHARDLDEFTAPKCSELLDALAAQRRLRDEAPQDVGEELQSARLACIREVLLTPSRLILVNEVAPTEGAVCDDLLSVLQRRGRLAEADARRLFTRLVLATKRAHDCGTVLRNIKPELVQVRQKEKGSAFEVCISKLYCAACVPPGDDIAVLTGLVGTPEYAAPEVSIWYWYETVPPRLPEPPPPYGSKADVWALGICLHVILCGCFPFTTSVSEEELLRTINIAEFAFNDPGWKKVSEEALDLVGQLLQRDPHDRPYLEEVLQHPFCSAALQEVMANEDSSSRAQDLDAAALDRALAELDSD